MRFGSLGWLLAGFAVAGTEGTEPGLTIVTRETFPAGVKEVTTYVGHDRIRLEARLSSQGPGAGSEQHQTVQIRRCDLNRMFVLDLQRRTYSGAPLRVDANAIERLALSVHRPYKESAEGPEIVIETTTVATGERRMVFGYSARRVLTTRRQIQTGDPDLTSETVTDGWYIDLETRPTCERQQRGARVVLTGYSRRAGGGNNPSRVTFKESGKPEEGFAVETTVTWRSAGQGTMSTAVATSHLLVTELSSHTLLPSLFEVPAGFRPAEGVLRRLTARAGRTAQVVQSAFASWFR